MISFSSSMCALNPSLEVGNKMTVHSPSQEYLESSTAKSYKAMLHVFVFPKERSELLTGHQCKALATLHLHGW